MISVKGMINNILILLFFLLMVFGQFGRFDLGIGFSIFYHEIVLILLVIANANKIIKTYLSKEMVFHRKPLLMFLLAVLISLVFNFWRYSGVDIAGGIFYAIRYFLYYQLFMLAILHNGKHNDFVYLAYLVCIFFAVLGFGQYFIFPDLRILESYGFDPFYYRMTSTLLDPNFFGALMVVGFYLGLTVKDRFPSAVFWLIQICLLAAIYLTYSRSAYISFVFSFSVFLYLKRKYFHILWLGIIVVSYLLFMPKSHITTLSLGRWETTSARLNNNRISYNLFRGSPFFGYGFNTVKYLTASLPDFADQKHFYPVRSGAGIDNSFLFMLCAAGIIGFGFYAYLVTIIIITFWRSDYKIYFISIMVAVIIHSQFNNSLFYPFILAFVFVVYGVSCRQS